MDEVAIRLVPYYHTFRDGQERPYCLNYTNSDGELAATRFTYNRKGLNDRAFYQQVLGGRSSRNLHSFDKQGRMVRKERFYNDGETSVEEFTYDDAGRLLEESFTSSKGVAGTARYGYDEAGRAVRMECRGYKGWLHGVIEFEFDDDALRTGGRILRDGALSGTIAYQYDFNGNLIREHWDLGGKWNQTLMYVYETAASDAG